MIIASRASRRPCATLYCTLRPCTQSQRSLALSASVTQAGNTEYHIEQHRTPAHKVTTIRTAKTFPRSLSTRKLSTKEAKRALRWLQKDQAEPVIQLVADVEAEEDRTYLLGEILQAIYASGTEKALEQFFSVLETLPNAHTATSAPFRGLLDVIRARNVDSDIGTLRRLGALCASKGYGEFVESDISPLISDGSSRLEFAQWQQSVALALAKFKGLVIDVDEVFEDIETDYQSIPVSPTTSIMQTVQESLPELLPNPTFSDGAMVFEDHNDDYTVVDSYTRHAQDHTISHAIQNLVRHEEFEQAYRLLQELGDTTQVESNLVYLEAAVASVNLPQTANAHEILEMEGRLFSWLSLVPTHDDNITYYIPSMLQLLERLETLSNHHFALLIKVSIFLARKGYTRYLTTTFCRTIFVYGSPEVVRSFIAELEDAHRQYYVKDYSGINYTQEHKIKVFLRGNAIRELARRKEFDTALAMLPDPRKDTWGLTPATYAYLLDRLQSHDQEAVLRNHLLQFATDHPLSLDLRKILPKWFWEGEYRPAATRARPVVTEAASLVDDLKRLRAQACDSKTVPPYPSTLVPTITQCVATGLMDDLTKTLNRACTRHWSFAASLLSAEMLYYQKQKYPLEIIKTFVDHFHICGVPTLQVLKLTNDGGARRIHNPSKLNISHKLWPSQDHVSLVWHALASLTKSTREYSGLYGRLRDFVQNKGRDIDPALSAQGIQALTPPTSPMSSMAYTPFIRDLGYRLGTKRAKGVFNDMAKDGMEPNLVHFTQLAGLYANAGQVKATMLILSHLEKVADGNKVADRQNFRHLGVKRWQVENEHLDTMLYKAIFAGFVKSKRWLPAWMVHRAMIRRFGFSKVVDDPTYRKNYGEAYHKAWSLFKKHGYPSIRHKVAEIEDTESRMQESLKDEPKISLHPPWQVQRKELIERQGEFWGKPPEHVGSRPLTPNSLLPPNRPSMKKRSMSSFSRLSAGSCSLEISSRRLRQTLKGCNHTLDTPPT